MRVILALLISLFLPSSSRGQDVDRFRILHTQQTDSLALFEVEAPNYGELVCGAHMAGRTLLWSSCHGPFASSLPFRRHYRGVTVSLLTSHSHILVVNCEARRTWWGGNRRCRVPLGPQVAGQYSGGRFPTRVTLRWSDGRGRQQEVFRLDATLARLDSR